MGMICFIFTAHIVGVLAQESPIAEKECVSDIIVTRYATAQLLSSLPHLSEGDLVATAGFFVPGDGGEALYRIQKLNDGLQPNEADVIALQNGLVAVLLESEAVNYRMFGAVGDGENDDGIQIKLAHKFANRHGIPVINLSGEFWIKQTNNIIIKTNVQWGNTAFYIDERFNARTARFVVLNDEPSKTLKFNEETKAILLEKIRPGVQIINELAPYAGHLIIVEDENDRIGRRGRLDHRGWARTELFKVEEEGRIIGDIAWEFNDFTSILAIPTNDVYLIIEGGRFFFSGETPIGIVSYHQTAFQIRRSRTIIREQWVGLEKGRRDVSMQPRRGIYVLYKVYNVTLENIRLMPFEQNRPDPAKVVPHGTYGIGGSHMMNVTFRNLTAEGGWVSWGVFGTNVLKDIRVEDSYLNRFDVHFHGWNIHISNSVIGFAGIAITGGGNLFVEDTTVHSNQFIRFRPDFGSRWDGRIRIRGSTLKPARNRPVSVLSFRPRDFDFWYPIGFGRSVTIEDMVIDFSAVPENTAPLWLMDIAPFSKISSTGCRLFFPNFIEFNDIRVKGREQGVRLLRIPNPHHFDLGRPGGYDGSRLKANSMIIVNRVQLEQLIPKYPGDTNAVHLLIGGVDEVDYLDEMSLFPEIRFIDCHGVSVYLGNNSIASVFFDRCSINIVTAPNLRGELVFRDCRFQPNVQEVRGDFYTLESTLGTRFTNCTIHAPIVAGTMKPEMVNRTGFLEINRFVRHFHLNTALCNRIIEHYRSQGMKLNPDFIAKLKLRHGMEE